MSLPPRPDSRQIGPDSKVPKGDSPHLEAGLYVVATPIGNLRDITLRALDVLGSADLVLAEDTRVTQKLLDAYGLKPKRASYHDHNGEAMRPLVLEALARGEVVALVSDAGTPLIADPGYKLVRAAAAAGRRVFPIPGASALPAALSVAGLPTDRFCFAGFPPAKAGARGAFFAELADLDATLVFYETGPRLAASLLDMARAFGDREAVVARELTKLFETVIRAPLADLAARDLAPKGEIVVLIGPPQAKAAPDASAMDERLRALLATHAVKEAAAIVAAEFNAPRKVAYARALALRAEMP
jgi:16S rRNA (cytidine1402-2'-O)-methyltransferase